jgi:hypothetical protein
MRAVIQQTLIKGSLSQSESFLKQWKKVRYWSQDESRMGLHTIHRRKLTGYGIKPQGKVQWDFTYTTSPKSCNSS